MPDQVPIAPVPVVPAPVPGSGNKITTILKLVLGILLAGGLLLGLLRCSGCKPPLPTIKINPTVVTPDTKHPVTTTPHSVTFTPLPTNGNPNPTPVTLPKPLEGNVVFKDGKVIIQHSGFTLEPFVGLSLTSSDGLRPYGAARVFFMDNLGLQVGANDRRAFLGLDYRLPVIDLMTISAGETLSYTGSTELYAGLNTQIKL